MVILLTGLITTACINRKVITVAVDGREVKFTTYKTTIRKILESKNIHVGPKDRVTPSLDSKPGRYDTIIIKRAVSIDVAVDGREIKIVSSEDTVDSMLKAEGITLSDEDKVLPGRDAELKDNMKVLITRVETKIVTEHVPVNFKEIVKNNKALPNTKRQIVQEGRNGEKIITASVVYENGKEVSRKILNETIIKEPTHRLIVQGTYPLMPVSRGGDIMPYKRAFKVRATAYWAVRGVGKTYTASGRKAVRNPDGFSTIAVDPSVIPYGTKLFVEGYGFAIAADTGTAIVGNKIDVFFDTYKEACRWGAKYVNLYVLE